MVSLVRATPGDDHVEDPQINKRLCVVGLEGGREGASMPASDRAIKWSVPSPSIHYICLLAVLEGFALL